MTQVKPGIFTCLYELSFRFKPKKTTENLKVLKLAPFFLFFDRRLKRQLQGYLGEIASLRFKSTQEEAGCVKFATDDD